MLVTDLIFSDLFVEPNPANSWFKQTPDSLVTHPVPPDAQADLIALRAHLESKDSKSSFKLNWPLADGGKRLRVERMTAANGDVVYVCRGYRIATGTLDSLGVPASIAAKLMDASLKRGLVVLMGKTGSGKTTVASSLVTELLRVHGGVCWTVENPVELELHGVHGKGRCYQTEVTRDEDIGLSIKKMLRATPNMIFIGELRDKYAVREAISAATNGTLILATFHANSLKNGLARLSSMAEDERASSSLADALEVAIHLSLYNKEDGKDLPGLTVPDSKGTGSPPRILSVESLWMTGDLQKGLQSIIRKGDFHMLESEITRQKNGLMMGKLP